MTVKEGQKFNLSAIEYHINLHIRGGYVIPTQTPGSNTYESRQKSFTLIAALDLNRQAMGQLLIDDGESVDTIKNKNYLLSEFKVGSNSSTTHWITISGVHQSVTPFPTEISTTVDIIKVYGVIDPLDPPYFTISGADGQPIDSRNATTLCLRLGVRCPNPQRLRYRFN